MSDLIQFISYLERISGTNLKRFIRSGIGGVFGGMVSIILSLFGGFFPTTIKYSIPFLSFLFSYLLTFIPLSGNNVRKLLKFIQTVLIGLGIGSSIFMSPIYIFIITLGFPILIFYRKGILFDIINVIAKIYFIPKTIQIRDSLVIAYLFEGEIYKTVVKISSSKTYSAQLYIKRNDRWIETFDPKYLCFLGPDKKWTSGGRPTLEVIKSLDCDGFQLKENEKIVEEIS